MSPVVPRRGPGYVPTTPRQPLSSAGAFTPPQPVNFDPAAQEIAKITQEHAQKADQVALLDADNQLSAIKTNLEVQTLQKRGKDAIGASAQVDEQWKQATSAIEATLTNDNQKENFRIRADHHYQVLNETVQKHSASEFQQYDAQNTEAALQNRRNDAVTHNTDPAIVGQSLAESKDLLTLYGQRNGWSDEEMKSKQADVASKIHAGVIQSLSDSGQDLTAKHYFDAHKGELVQSDLAHSSDVVKASSVKGEAQRQRDKIVASNSNMTDAITAARKIEDPDVQEATERLVRQDFLEKAAALRDQREQLMTGATNIVERTHSFDSIPASQIALMSVGERASLRSYADAFQKTGTVRTDLTRYYALVQMATTPETHDKFLQLDLNQEKPNLSPSDFEEMVKLQASVRKGEEKPLKQLYTNQQIVSGVINQAQIGVDKKGKVLDKGMIAQFREAVRQQTDQFEAENGRLPTGDEVKRIANELATQHVVERPRSWWFGTSGQDVRTFQMTQGEVPILSIRDVPAQAKAQIRNALTNRHLPVTDQAIIDEYRRHVQTLVPEP